MVVWFGGRIGSLICLVLLVLTRFGPWRQEEKSSGRPDGSGHVTLGLGKRILEHVMTVAEKTNLP